MSWALVVSGVAAAGFFLLGFDVAPLGGVHTLCMLGGVASGMMFVGLTDGA